MSIDSNKLLADINEVLEDHQNSDFRDHIGCSALGNDCTRATWYSFRWLTKPRHSGRILRLFARGEREEDVLCELLLSIGLTVDNRQKKVDFPDVPQLGGSIDGTVEVDGEEVLVEFKTSNKRSHIDLVKKGKLFSARPKHYDQCQLYMIGLGLKSCIYLSVCKDDDHIYSETIEIDSTYAHNLVWKAKLIVDTPIPPPRISSSPAWYECKWCDHYKTCQTGEKLPEQNCRTCEHSSISSAGTGTWLCTKFNNKLDIEKQRAGCDYYTALPALLDRISVSSEVSP